MKAEDYKISAEKFVLHTQGEDIHDTKLETKPVSYFKDAFYRFRRNKGSIFATWIIVILFLFAFITPLVSPYTVSFADNAYAYVLPRNSLFVKLGIPIWDGGKKIEVNEAAYKAYEAIEQEIGRKVILSEPEIIEQEYMGKTTKLYDFRLDTYNAVGARFVLLDKEQYIELQQYQDEMNVQVILPVTDPKLRPEAEQDKGNANIWYKTKLGKGRKTEIVYSKDGELIPVYKAADGTDLYTSKMFWEGDTKKYNYAEPKDGNMWNVRVDYKEYFAYQHHKIGDKITEPSFLFGATEIGKDIFICLASGAKMSILLAVVINAVNMFVGAIIGAIEGYYGGKVDLVLERIMELLGSVPMLVVITLLKYYLHVEELVILFLAFFATGWIGMAGLTRMQFYRFKNMEHVLVARTLGANDKRIMFKHIFPNGIGTIITSCVLTIPSFIFAETTYAYLGIINISTGNRTSVGTLLSAGQSFLFTYPHMIIPPSIFISLLMLCFNLFGNGLRDAFNPSLRGTEE